MNRHLPLLPLVLLVACDGARVDVPVYGLTLSPVVPEGADPFTEDAELTVWLDDGLDVVQRPLGSSPDATWTLDDVDDLDGTRVGLLLTDPGAALDPLDYLDVRAWGQTAPLTLSEGDERQQLLVTPYARGAAFGSLTAGQTTYLPGAVMLPDGDVMLFGGSNALIDAPLSSGGLDQILRLSRADDDLAFRRVADIPSFPNAAPPRVAPTATLVRVDGLDQVLVVGGRTAFSPPNSARGQAFLYDPAADEVTWNGVAPSDRSQHVAVPLGGDVWIGGGLDGSGQANTFLTFDWFRSDTGRFEAGSQTISGVGTVGFGHGVMAEDLGLMVCGGASQTSGPNLFELTGGCARIAPDGGVFPLPVFGEGADTAPDVSERAWHTLTRLGDGRMLLTGGITSPVTVGESVPATAEAWIYDPDPAARTWERTGDLNRARAMHRALPLPDGRVIVFGGTTQGWFLGPDTGGDAVTCPELYDPTEGTFELLACDPALGGALPAVASVEGFDAFVLSGASDDDGGTAWGLIGQGPAQP